MKKSGEAEKYVRVVQDIYERSRTVVRCAVGQTEEFNVEVGLHQGSALSPFLFAIVMDQLSEQVRQESPWTMMFADDIVICSESREQVEENQERWRFALERRGMKVSCRKTEYMSVNEREKVEQRYLHFVAPTTLEQFTLMGTEFDSVFLISLEYCVNMAHMIIKRGTVNKIIIKNHAADVLPLASGIFYSVVCWGSRVKMADANRLNKLIRKACSFMGVELESLIEVSDRRF
ncbi:hypothetical protein QTP86_009621 [Hemibagrus guttatus]|nr:hypothetical protein QTP86_009621 [Hemibagrus guttatus]